MSSEMELRTRLIEEYYYNYNLLKVAEKEGAAETVKIINQKLEIIRLQLQPLELPN